MDHVSKFVGVAHYNYTVEGVAYLTFLWHLVFRPGLGGPVEHASLYVRSLIPPPALDLLVLQAAPQAARADAGDALAHGGRRRRDHRHQRGAHAGVRHLDRGECPPDPAGVRHTPPRQVRLRLRAGRGADAGVCVLRLVPFRFAATAGKCVRSLFEPRLGVFFLSAGGGGRAGGKTVRCPRRFQTDF